jgi:hypothetical protein
MVFGGGPFGRLLRSDEVIGVRWNWWLCKKERAGGMAQVVERLRRKIKALTSNPSTAKKEKKERKKEKGKERDGGGERPEPAGSHTLPM